MDLQYFTIQFATKEKRKKRNNSKEERVEA
jgi:hypothetical protein